MKKVFPKKYTKPMELFISKENGLMQEKHLMGNISLSRKQINQMSLPSFLWITLLKKLN
jgi:hypothetical protein